MMARKAKKSAKDEGEISLDDAVNVLRQAMMDGTGAPIVDAAPGRSAGVDATDDGIIELTAMVKPPKGYRSLEDYRVRGPKDTVSAADGGTLDSMIGSLISAKAGEQLRQDLQEVIRPILRRWLVSNLESIVNDILDSELKNSLGMAKKRKSK